MLLGKVHWCPQRKKLVFLDNKSESERMRAGDKERGKSKGKFGRSVRCTGRDLGDHALFGDLDPHLNWFVQRWRLVEDLAELLSTLPPCLP
jgi:hypothetical protein